MRSTRDAIIGAALARFASEGFATPLRTIGADAGVSAALIVHHFGSKQGLRDAVDEHVLGIADEKLRLFGEQGTMAAAAFVFTLMQEGHLPAYLARVLIEGGDAGLRLFSSFVDVTEKALLDLEIADARMSAAVLCTHSLGMMIMSEQVAAATGVAPYTGDGLTRLVPAVVGLYRGALSPVLEGL